MNLVVASFGDFDAVAFDVHVLLQQQLLLPLYLMPIVDDDSQGDFGVLDAADFDAIIPIVQDFLNECQHYYLQLVIHLDCDSYLVVLLMLMETEHAMMPEMKMTMMMTT